MVYGYGPVAFSTFSGFLLDLIFAHYQTSFTTGSVQFYGFLALAIGIITMIARRIPVTGPLGGLITGFGLGLSADPYIWPPSTIFAGP